MKSPHTEHQGRNWTALWISLLAVVALAIGILAAEKAVVPQPSAVVSLTLPATAPADDPKALTNTIYGKLPLIFEANRGQTDAQVRFLSRGPGYTLFLTANEAVFNLRASSPTESDPAAVKFSALRMSLLDANPQPEIGGLEMTPTQVNYLLGQDRQQWRTHIATYSKVQLQEIYPGISLVYYGNQRQLEYDFVVAPGADPGQIRVQFAGLNEAVQATLADNGDLLLKMAVGGLRRRQSVDGQVVLRSTLESASDVQAQDKIAEIGFAIAAYDRSQPLVIDPVLAYSTFLGGIGSETATSIAVDKEGNAYVTGSTGSIDFPVVTGCLKCTLSGTKTLDAFVSKINVGGTALIYSTYLGGTATSDKDDVGYGIAIDDSGNAYVVGTTSSDIAGTPKGTKDAFIVILDVSGSSLLYKTYWGGAKDEDGRGIALTSNFGGQTCGKWKCIYITGYTTSTANNTTATDNFPLSSNPFQPALLGGTDAFVSVINPNITTGSVLLYSTYLGGTKDDKGYAIAVDGTGKVYVTGSTASTNFPVTGSSFDTALGGSQDAFVVKIDPDPAIPGTRSLIFSTYLGGGSGTETGNGIAVDNDGNVYVTGATGSPDFPVIPGTIGKYASNGDAFIAKIHSTGAALVYSMCLGGSGIDSGAAIIVADAKASGGDLYTYVTGTTTSTNFPYTPGAFNKTIGGSSDAFVVQVSEDGDKLLYSTYLGGKNGADSGAAIAVDLPERAIEDGFSPTPYNFYGVYIAGLTSSSDFPVTPDAFDAINGSSADAFITKLGTAPVDLRVALSCDPNKGVGTPMACIMEAYNDAALPASGSPPAPMTTLIARLPSTVTLNPASIIFLDGKCELVVTTLTCRANKPLLYGKVPFSVSFTITPKQPVSIIITAETMAAINDETTSNNVVTVTLSSVVSYPLSVLWTGTGRGTVSSGSYYTPGATVKLTATPDAGSAFAGWTPTPAGGPCTATFAMPANALTCTAKFVINQYVLTAVKAGTGSGTVIAPGIACGADCTQPYTNGTLVTLAAAPATNSVFGGWTGCTPVATNPQQCKVAVTAARTVTARFNRPVLKVSKVGSGLVISSTTGINCGPVCTAPYNLNAVITLIAIPTTGSFVGWSGCTAGSNPNFCTVKMNQSKMVTATFK
ncbi:MAG: SBBP repeat-containing protein [Candidatus Contendobacter sp.]|nr:SBBP repeat-containing protein [Candidatus Contendobacter sp.]